MISPTNIFPVSTDYNLIIFTWLEFLTFAFFFFVYIYRDKL